MGVGRGVLFATRLALAFGALDLTFKLLVGAAFIQVLGGRGELVATIAKVCAPIWPVWLAFVWIAARPVDRRSSPEELRRAGERAMRLPRLLALAWALEWAVAFTVVVAVDGHGYDLGNILFISALALGPIPLAHAFVTWFVAKDTRAIELAARERGVELDIPKSTIRSRMLIYALCLVIAPSAYMAAIGVGARIHLTASDSVVTAIVVGFGAITLFAVLCAILIANAFTRPIVEMSSVVREVGEHGSVQQAGRIPQYQQDEIGVLVGLTNEMMARLERTESALEKSVADTRASLEREMSTRSKIEHELAVAQRIQTSILPQHWDVAELEIAASMVTATQVGGDYYDILPREKVAWIAIGDVSGHGVSAGMIMLMLQSITATLVDALPHASARDLVVAINRTLFTNVRHRLQARDFVTFTLLRYEAGVVKFAGAHEDIIVWRAKTGTCERVATPGPWLGASADLSRVTVENELSLEPDDLLVLYTDGITEALDDKKQQFGIDRLCSTIEALAKEGVAKLVPGVIEAALAWCAKQEDDMSIVVARRR
jgi:serine phosphatase RsbU (regulator of sigma subunit)